MQPLTEGWWW